MPPHRALPGVPTTDKLASQNAPLLSCCRRNPRDRSGELRSPRRHRHRTAEQRILRTLFISSPKGCTWTIAPRAVLPLAGGGWIGAS
jgi:hypothetical protein